MPARSPVQHRGRRPIRGIALAAALLLVGSCKVDTTVEVTTDRTGAGTVTVTINTDAEVARAAPDLPTDLRVADLKSAGWLVDGPSARPDGGLALVLHRPVTTPEETSAVLAQLSGPDGPFHGLTLTQERSFANITTTLNGTIEVRSGLSAFVDSKVVQLLGGAPYAQTLAERNLALNDVVDLRLIATAPGTIRSTDGVTSAPVGAGTDTVSTVEWRADLTATGPRPVTLVSALRDLGAQNARRWRDFAPWAAAAWGVFFVGVVLPVIHLVHRRRRRAL